MKCVSIKEISEKWQISARRVNVLCNQNRISGAYKIGDIWAIPENAVKPSDPRIRKNKTKKDVSFEDGLRLVTGTFAVEGYTLSEETKINLELLANGKKSADSIIKEIIAEYSTKQV